jgi:uncharacterized cupin superfamily protein
MRDDQLLMAERAARISEGDLDGVEAVLEDGALARTATGFAPGDGLTAGVWESEAVTWDSGAAGYPVDEICVILSGTVVLRYPDGTEDAYGPGEAFAIERGTPLVWHQDGTVRKYFTIRER